MQGSPVIPSNMSVNRLACKFDGAQFCMPNDTASRADHRTGARGLAPAARVRKKRSREQHPWTLRVRERFEQRG